MTTSPDPYLHTPSVPTVAQTTSTTTAAGSLPHTGNDARTEAYAAGGLVLVGAALVAVAAARLRHHHPKENT